LKESDMNKIFGDIKCGLEDKNLSKEEKLEILQDSFTNILKKINLKLNNEEPNHGILNFNKTESIKHTKADNMHSLNRPVDSNLFAEQKASLCDRLHTNGCYPEAFQINNSQANNFHINFPHFHPSASNLPLPNLIPSSLNSFPQYPIHMQMQGSPPTASFSPSGNFYPGMMSDNYASLHRMRAVGEPMQISAVQRANFNYNHYLESQYRMIEEEQTLRMLSYRNMQAAYAQYPSWVPNAY